MKDALKGHALACGGLALLFLNLSNTNRGYLVIPGLYFLFCAISNWLAVPEERWFTYIRPIPGVGIVWELTDVIALRLGISSSINLLGLGLTMILFGIEHVQPVPLARGLILVGLIMVGMCWGPWRDAHQRVNKFRGVTQVYGGGQPGFFRTVILNPLWVYAEALDRALTQTVKEVQDVRSDVLDRIANGTGQATREAIDEVVRLAVVELELVKLKDYPRLWLADIQPLAQWLRKSPWWLLLAISPLYLLGLLLLTVLASTTWSHTADKALRIISGEPVEAATEARARELADRLMELGQKGAAREDVKAEMDRAIANWIGPV
jgi:hypothetical protein